MGDSVVPTRTFAEQWHAGDGLQRALRSRFLPRLMPGVDMTSAVKSWVKIFYVFIRFSPC